jgi:hypothetical protein
MLNDKIISKSEHEKFLANLEEDTSQLYFMVVIDNTPIGAIYFSGVGKRNVTWGCYIGEGNVIPGLFLVFIYIAGKEVFYHYGARELCSEVNSLNLPPQRANKFLGIGPASILQEKTGLGKKKSFLSYRVLSDEWDDLAFKIKSILPSSAKNIIKNYRIEEGL